ncbi:MAG: glutamine-hydrolyzing GMP synthase [Candidatus Niyogibacteria bacterium CG10_big_fil_rev_8_21_14_0_10_46_36]|uniref:GMP synthase [glutamine-hydrolyzing] n=1 Tax=Candidatus Niyogibacteria bacterium CG10_big_fil_rev_8_21_14_0_10_46_36 TaxID=1974726 RepID=A0A2H0TG36_9BACT|nr:MAG: glutamine-hydrolyzing GMP synthase [Candidatus Niyogibacteria bacterium CG10_big_fil_rev_8_21_14_0_10_46_36]
MIVILNFGSQFAHLIARRIRDLGVRAEILHFQASIEEIRAFHPVGIILSGGPRSVLENGYPRPQKEIFELGIPVFGICYGAQVMAKFFGGVVRTGEVREYGKEKISCTSRNPLFKGLTKKEPVWFSHGDYVYMLPQGFQAIASTEACAHAAFAHEKKPWFGVQFHPEVAYTKRGKDIIANFVFSVCGAKKNWSMPILKDEIIASMREMVGDAHVVIALSGGVDSLVAATLLHRAIGRQLHGVFVDNGLLRKDEVGAVGKAITAQGLHDIRTVDARKNFLERLKGIEDPEKKRKIIGHTFIHVFERMIAYDFKKYPVRFLAQGTIYPDRIESAYGSHVAEKIKSHHNLTLPERFGFHILEPLADLYKDEVRRLGEELRLPKKVLWRHPFPGPGLSIRVVGEVTEERLHMVREADAIYIEELRRAGEYGKIWQAFAVLLPLRTVGVMGDARTYEHIIALRAVHSVDGMTADWYKMNHSLLERISNRIVREVKGVNRVLYDITQKPPATIEYE